MGKVGLDLLPRTNRGIKVTPAPGELRSERGGHGIDSGEGAGYFLPGDFLTETHTQREKKMHVPQVGLLGAIFILTLYSLVMLFFYFRDHGLKQGMADIYDNFKIDIRRVKRWKKKRTDRKQRRENLTREQRKEIKRQQKESYEKLTTPYSVRFLGQTQPPVATWKTYLGIIAFLIAVFLIILFVCIPLEPPPPDPWDTRWD